MLRPVFTYSILVYTVCSDLSLLVVSGSILFAQACLYLRYLCLYCLLRPVFTYSSWVYTVCSFFTYCIWVFFTYSIWVYSVCSGLPLLTVSGSILFAQACLYLLYLGLFFLLRPFFTCSILLYCLLRLVFTCSIWVYTVYSGLSLLTVFGSILFAQAYLYLQCLDLYCLLRPVFTYCIWVLTYSIFLLKPSLLMVSWSILFAQACLYLGLYCLLKFVFTTVSGSILCSSLSLLVSWSILFAQACLYLQACLLKPVFTCSIWVYTVC